MPAPSDSVCSSPIALSYSCIAAVPGTLLSGLFVCPAELPYNQADVGLFVRPRSNTIRQMSVCMSGRAHIQSGTRGFESLAGSVLEEDQYNQAYELMTDLVRVAPDCNLSYWEDRNGDSTWAVLFSGGCRPCLLYTSPSPRD